MQNTQILVVKEAVAFTPSEDMTGESPWRTKTARGMLDFEVHPEVLKNLISGDTDLIPKRERGAIIMSEGPYRYALRSTVYTRITTSQQKALPTAHHSFRSSRGGDPLGETRR